MDESPNPCLIVTHCALEAPGPFRTYLRRLAGSFTARITLLTLLALPIWGVAADQPPVPPGKGSVSPSGKFTPREGRQPGERAPAESVIKSLGGGKLKVGDVLLDQFARTVLIPAEVNMYEGVMEYALVMESGKRHESIFSTRATAEHIHIACMLLGMNAARQGAGEAVPDAQAVKIEVAWDTNGPEKRIPLSDCVALAEGSGGPGRILPNSPWIYVGSQMDAAGFIATREGSLISLITDSTALINNPHLDRENDKIHLANGQNLPRKGVAVRIILTLPSSKSTSAPAEKTLHQ